jgi:hypothetical protein
MPYDTHGKRLGGPLVAIGFGLPAAAPSGALLARTAWSTASSSCGRRAMMAVEGYAGRGEVGIHAG